MIPFFLIQ